MKKVLIVASFLSVLPFIGCNKPEVIPTPENRADLKVHFQAVINGSDVEWTKNVDGYAAEPTKQIVSRIDPIAQLEYNELAYKYSMKSSSKVSFISIALGALEQDATLGTSPNMITFRNFIDSNLTPDYSDTARAGFEVRYTDEAGVLYRSDETAPGNVQFLDIEEKEDAKGEYIQFTCRFNCIVKNWGKKKTDPTKDSVYSTAYIQDAVLKGYFKR